MTKFFKIQKTPILDSFWALFTDFRADRNFSRKIRFCHFFLFLDFYCCAEFQKKTKFITLNWQFFCANAFFFFQKHSCRGQYLQIMQYSDKLIIRTNGLEIQALDYQSRGPRFKNLLVDPCLSELFILLRFIILGLITR